VSETVHHRPLTRGREEYANTRRASLELMASREQGNRHTVHHWSTSAQLTRKKCLRL